MSLVNEQAVFLADVCRLITFSQSNGFVVTGGELYRTAEQQAIYEKQGRASKGCWNSHGSRLAIDLNFFRHLDDKLILTYKKEDIQPVGDYWCSLDKINVWGGNWKTLVDTPHFERRISH